VTTAGAAVGEHRGYARFTIGQRKGLPGGFAEPMFVVAIRPESRTVVIGPADQLDGRSLTLGEVNWLADPLRPGDECLVQVRYRAPAVPARVGPSDGETFRLELLHPVRAITPGQSGVLYAGDRLLGGGIIQ
jgi:tRNA-specific 2-thiouridylase